MKRILSLIVYIGARKAPDQLRQVYENTEKVFIMDVDVLNILNMHLKDYVEGNTDNLDGVAEQIKADIEAIL